MTSAEIGIVLEPRRDVHETLDRAKLAEKNGYEYIGITDGQMIWRDVSVALTASAGATTRIHMGPWVTNPVTRHLAVTANFISTLDEFSGGRAILGIGNGDDAVRTLGSGPATMDALGEIVDSIRNLMDGKEVFNKAKVGWKIATGGRGHRVPIYWAGANKKSMQYGTKHADGLIMSGFVDEGWITTTLDIIREAAAESGRSPKLIFNSSVSVDEDGAVAREAVRPYVASGLRYHSSALVSGWSDEDVERMRAVYNPYHHFRESNEAAVALVPDEMIPKKSISGTPEECAELMQTVIDHGITSFSLMPMGDVEKTIRLLAQEVRPRLS
jgi:alkanesulfonate monooxygenase SsuD/methylene tetrahydromethanopterin reductase-like flavin-dependent oxidoreductase (luciferase family)